MRFLLIFLFLLTQTQFVSSQQIVLDDIVAGFEIPVDITHAGDDRLFIVEKTGAIKILNADGSVNPTPFLDIDAIVNSGANERGLLGLAFHPDYATNGYFFVYYTNSGGSTVVSRFSVTADANIADPNSEKLIFTTSQPFSNHNGGCIKFSPADGYLYIGIGDGGSGGDPQDNGQDGLSFLGKILRLDVNTTGTYNIPPDNPFVDEPMIRDEIWSYGWRNPWRFSFDKNTDDMWVGDVGQNEWEEVDFELAGDGGRNYGWRCYEGNVQYNFNGCDENGDYTFPFFVYANSSFNLGCSVTGGFVYRGQEYPSLFGNYIFADFCSGQFWLTRNSDCGFITTENIQGSRNEYSAFGEDVNGELYVAALGEGRIYKITTACDLDISSVITEPSCIGAADGSIDLEISGTSAINSITWSTGVGTPDLMGIPAGEYTVIVEDASGCILERCFRLEEPEGQESCEGALILAEGCPGGSVTISSPCDVPAGMMIRWFRNGELIVGAEDIAIVTSEDGIYSIQFYDANCALAVSDIVDYSLFPVVAAPDFVQDGNTLVADAGFFQYIWYKNGIEVQNGSSNILDISEDASYSVQGRDNIGCLTLISDEVFIALSSTLEDLGISNLEIFPNPFSDDCTIKMQLLKAKDLRIEVLDSKGSVLFKKELQAKTEFKETIDLKQMPAGLYMLRIEVSKKQLLKKIIKQ